MRTPERTRFIGDMDALQIWWFVSGSLINFSSGYTFAGDIAPATDLTNLVRDTKTTGFVGAAGSGTEGNGVPNLVVDWATSGDLIEGLDPGQYVLQIVATKVADGSETTYQMILNMQTRLGAN